MSFITDEFEHFTQILSIFFYFVNYLFSFPWDLTQAFSSNICVVRGLIWAYWIIKQLIYCMLYLLDIFIEIENNLICIINIWIFILWFLPFYKKLKCFFMPRFNGNFSCCICFKNLNFKINSLIHLQFLWVAWGKMIYHPGVMVTNKEKSDIPATICAKRWSLSITISLLTNL